MPLPRPGHFAASVQVGDEKEIVRPIKVDEWKDALCQLVELCCHAIDGASAESQCR